MPNFNHTDVCNSELEVLYDNTGKHSLENHKSDIEMATFVCPINIALAKYWGKKDESANIPFNDSLSLTLGTNEISTQTTAAISPLFDRDRMWLNGVEVDITSTPRVVNLLQQFRSLSDGALDEEVESEDSNVPLIKRARSAVEPQWRVHICSRNNFPTAAGMASSASGYAALTLALDAIFNGNGGCDGEPVVSIRDLYPIAKLEELSKLARLGSGSACRSLAGPIVRWYAGTCHEDSFARPIATSFDFSSLRVLILVVNDARKTVGSTEGMARTVRTSPLLKYRVSDVIAPRIDAMISCLQSTTPRPHRDHVTADGYIGTDQSRSFSHLCELIMRESDQLHAVCRDSYPPITYMTDVSDTIARLVHAYNQSTSPPSGAQNRVAYSFDAGPNAFLFLNESDVCAILSIVTHYFPPNERLRAKYRSIEETLPKPPEYNELSRTLTEMYELLGTSIKVVTDAISDVIYTRSGNGPTLLTTPQDSLLNVNGYPKDLAKIED